MRNWLLEPDPVPWRERIRLCLHGEWYVGPTRSFVWFAYGCQYYDGYPCWGISVLGLNLSVIPRKRNG